VVAITVREDLAPPTPHSRFSGPSVVPSCLSRPPRRPRVSTSGRERQDQIGLGDDVRRDQEVRDGDGNPAREAQTGKRVVGLRALLPARRDDGASPAASSADQMASSRFGVRKDVGARRVTSVGGRRGGKRDQVAKQKLGADGELASWILLT
jgi:hypothetical protein